MDTRRIKSIASPSSRPQSEAELHIESSAHAWRPLYQIGAVGALLAVTMIAVAVVVAIDWPIPATVDAWFARYHQSAFAGLLDLDVPLVASYVALIPVYLALYVALRRVDESLMALALVADLIGAALMLAVNPAFALLSLSSQYVAATTDAQRTIAAAAAQTLLANWQGTGFDVAYFLGAVATLLIAAVMLRSAIFTKATAYAGLVMGALALVPATAGTVGVVLSGVACADSDLASAGRLSGLAARIGRSGRACPPRVVWRVRIGCIARIALTICQFPVDG